MNTSTLRYLALSLFASMLIVGGLYLATKQRAADSVTKRPTAKTDLNSGNSATAGSVQAKSNERTSPSLAPAMRPNVFGVSGEVRLEDVPEGRFRNELARLNEPARRHALEKLGRLQMPLNDVASLSVEANGQLFYQCHSPRLPPPAAPIVALTARNEASARLPSVPVRTEAAAAVPIGTPPVRHSRPGATKVIYLDFNGHTISGTAWNNARGSVGDANYRPAVASYAAKAFDTDSNPGSFSDAEQAVIVSVWERVAEDYKAFDVDVTTEEPATFTANTGRILITDNLDANGVNMPSSTGGGVAYLDVFGDSNYPNYYSPALVYANQNYNYSSYIAEGASHEMGHNLSLSHDGTTTGDEYYDGHGSGDTSWDTIMGGAFAENVTQWSKGEYYNANNLQDDLAIIAGHLGYVTDDFTDSNATATPITVNGLAISGAGVISQTGDADRLSFESGPGGITINATTFRSASQSHGGNLDVALELYDAGGALVASANADGATDATLYTAISGGSYYLRVLGTGSGTPLNNPPSGYTSYGSLGAYTITGTIQSTAPVAPSFLGGVTDQTVYATQAAQFSVAVGAYPPPSFQWQRLPSGSGTWSNLADGGVYLGSGTNTLNITSSSLAMNGDRFRCVATNAVGGITSGAVVLTVNPLIAPIIIGLPATVTLNYNDTLDLYAPSIASTGRVTYQWNKNGAAILGATAEHYTVYYSATPANNGIYTLTATNFAGSTTSSNCTVTVNLPTVPVITQQPVSAVVLATVGQTYVTFTVTATGTPPLTYKWYFNGQPISSTDPILYVYDVKPTDAGNYSVVVTSPGGSTTSNVASLSIRPSLGVVSANATSGGFSQFILADGTLWGMGYNRFGQLGDGGAVITVFSPAGITAGVGLVGTGAYHSLLVKADGTLWVLGRNESGQLGDGTTLDSRSPVQIATGVVSAVGGFSHSLFIKSDGTLWGMGLNGNGQLGDGTILDRHSPVQIATNVVLVSAGNTFSLFVRADGTLWAMGNNSYGQLGDGTTNERHSPVQIATGVASVAGGDNHSLFIKTDGTLWATGADYRGQLGDGGSSGHSTPVQVSTGVATVSAGQATSLFVKTDGTLWAMGYNASGQLGDGTTTDRFNPVQVAAGVRSVSTGNSYALFTKTDGSLCGMGSSSGNLGVRNPYSPYYPTPVPIVQGTLVVPGSPTGAASAGASGQGIRLGWNPTLAATDYEVWRNTLNNFATATRIASNIPISLFYDRTAAIQSTYYYWIKAVNPAGAGNFSNAVFYTGAIAPSSAIISIAVE